MTDGGSKHARGAPDCSSVRGLHQREAHPRGAQARGTNEAAKFSRADSVGPEFYPELQNPAELPWTHAPAMTAALLHPELWRAHHQAQDINPELGNHRTAAHRSHHPSHPYNRVTVLDLLPRMPKSPLGLLAPWEHRAGCSHLCRVRPCYLVENAGTKNQMLGKPRVPSYCCCLASTTNHRSHSVSS